MKSIFDLVVIIIVSIAFVFMLSKIFIKLPIDLQKTLLDLWAYKEIRIMLAACLFIYFSSVFFPIRGLIHNEVNIPNEVRIPSKIDINHKLELTGKNSYSPIEVEVKNK